MNSRFASSGSGDQAQGISDRHYRTDNGRPRGPSAAAFVSAESGSGARAAQSCSFFSACSYQGLPTACEAGTCACADLIGNAAATSTAAAEQSPLLMFTALSSDESVCVPLVRKDRITDGFHGRPLRLQSAFGAHDAFRETTAALDVHDIPLLQFDAPATKVHTTPGSAPNSLTSGSP